jgi:hypothetical protein
MIRPEDLSYDELEEIINQILTGTKLVYIETEKGEEIPLLFRRLGAEDRLRADIVYRDKFNRARREGILTRSEMEEIIYERNLFSMDDEETVKKLEGKLKAQQEVLRRTTRVPARQDRLIGIINDLEQQLRNIKSKKDQRLQLTCESLATEEKFLFVLWKSTYNIESELFWETITEFRNHKDPIFKTDIINKFVDFYSGFDIRLIRFLARSNIWRIRYAIARKTGSDLFGIPVKDYSSDMLSIMYWSDFYTSIYEMMPEDRPSESIIEDDAALDAYMEAFYAEKSREYAARRSGKGHKGASAFSHDEVIVTKSNPMFEDIEYTKIPKRAEKSSDTEMSEKQLKRPARNKKDLVRDREAKLIAERSGEV